MERGSAAFTLHDEKSHCPDAEASREHRKQKEPRISGEASRLGHHAPEVHDREEPEDHGREREVGFHARVDRGQMCGADVAAESGVDCRILAEERKIPIVAR